jgi:hypothetical protein
MSRYPHDPEQEEGVFGVEVSRRYPVGGEDFHRCTVCGVLYDEGDSNVCAAKLAVEFDDHVHEADDQVR